MIDQIWFFAANLLSIEMSDVFIKYQSLRLNIDISNVDLSNSQFHYL
jgi:hypothetical protein